MSREYSWPEPASRVTNDEQRHAIDYWPRSYDADATMMYDQTLYSHEGPTDATSQRYAAVPHDRVAAAYPDYRSADIVVTQPGPSFLRDPAYDYGVQDWRSGPANGASERSSFTLPVASAQSAWHAIEQQPPPQSDTAIRLPAARVAVAASKDDLEGTARASAAGKERKKATTATRRCRPASCTPCRRRKMRCSRSKPCTACVSRGDPEGCLWEGDAVPLYTASEDDEVTKLQAHVRHLEAMLAKLPPAKKRFPPSASRRPSPRATATPPTQPPSSECYDLTAQDLAGPLLSLITAGTVGPARAGQDSFLPDGQSSRGLLAECEALAAAVSAEDQRRPFGPLATAAVGSSTIMTPSPEGLLALVPPERELHVAFDFYRSTVASFYFSVNHDEIEARWPRMKAILDACDATLFAAEFDPHFFALVLATCVVGRSRMPESLARVYGMSGDSAAESAAWGKIAAVFLEIPREVPTLSTIQAATVLGIFYMSTSSGTLVTRGMRMFSLGASAALELGLNRDPLEGTLRECEEHRRTFWALFVLSINATSTTGKTWPIFDLRYVDCAFPQDYYNDELDLDEGAATARLRARRASGKFEETWITNQVHHFKIAYLAKATYDEVFAARSCSYEAVLEQDKKFVEVESEMPEAYHFRNFHDEPLTITVQRAVILHTCLSAEVMRLHRPFLSLAAIDKRFEYSRARCIKHARRTLYLYSADWLLSFLPRFLACICILLDLLSGRTEEREGDLERVQYACAQLDAVRHKSPLHERGRKVLQYLLNRVQPDRS